MKKESIFEILPDSTTRSIDFGAYGLGTDVKMEVGKSIINEGEAAHPMLIIEVPLDDGHSHKFQLIFMHPASLEQLMHKLTTLMIGGLYPNSVHERIVKKDE